MADSASSSMSPHEPSGAVLVVRWPLGRGDVAALCEDVAAVLSGRDFGVVLCDVSDLSGADLAAVDCLARLQLAARRNGGEIRLANACGQLLGLLRLAGLTGVLRPAPGA